MSDELTITTNWKGFPFEEIIELYNSVNWRIYTKAPDELKVALENSSLVLLAIKNGKVVGLARSLSDRVSIHYLQDILVTPSDQSSGIGRQLLSKALDHYKGVRTHLLLTDNEEKQRRFYESLDFKNTKGLEKTPLNCFVKMNSISLE